MGWGDLWGHVERGDPWGHVGVGRSLGSCRGGETPGVMLGWGDPWGRVGWGRPLGSCHGLGEISGVVLGGRPQVRPGPTVEVLPAEPASACRNAHCVQPRRGARGAAPSCERPAPLQRGGPEGHPGHVPQHGPRGDPLRAGGPAGQQGRGHQLPAPDGRGVLDTPAVSPPARPPSSPEHCPQQIPVNAPHAAPSSDVCVATLALVWDACGFGSCSRSPRGRGGWGGSLPASCRRVEVAGPVHTPTFCRPSSQEALLGAAPPQGFGSGPLLGGQVVSGDAT